MISMRRVGLVLLAAAASACGGGDGITVTHHDCTPVALSFPGSASGSLSPTGCVSDGFPAAIYTFTASGSGGTTFSVTGSVATTIEVRTNPAGNNVAINSQQTDPVTGEWLLPAGNYLMRVSAQAAGAAGTFTVTGTSTNGASNNGSGCTAGVPLRLLVVGGTYSSQSLNTGDCTAVDGSYIDYYIIRSLKPCTITFTPTGFDAYLGIFDIIGGTSIATKDDFTTGLAEHIDLATCSTATGNPIEIQANTFASGETGTYTLSVVITGGGSLVDGTRPAGDETNFVSPIDVGRLLGQDRPRLFKTPR